MLSISNTLLIHELILLPSSMSKLLNLDKLIHKTLNVSKVFEDGDTRRSFRVARDGDIIRDGDVTRDGNVTRDGDVIDRLDMGPYDTEVKSHSFNF